MQTNILLSVSSQDKPGVVEAISSTVERCGANWLESRLAHLSGKFVGVIHISVDQHKANELELELKKLGEQGIMINLDSPSNNGERNDVKTAKFSAVGPDKTGIVKEIAAALSQKGINVEELETNISSMPYSGEPIFEAQGIISIPGNADLNDLNTKLDAIANELGLDLDITS